MSFSGVVGGGKFGNPRVEAHSSDTYDYVFYGNQDAVATISGDGDTDLDLYVYDENWNEVCHSTSNGDDEVCTWNPRWTGTFKIVVKNLGNIFNRYHITLN